MKRLLLLITALCFGFAAKGDDRASAILAKLSGAVRALGDYSVEFEIHAGSYNATGRYVVSGDSYYMKIDDAEVYSDGKVRREVNGVKKEVVIDAVDLSGRNILNNPTRAFDFIGTQYVGAVETSPVGTIAIRLKPMTGGKVTGDVVVTVDTEKYLPKSIIYQVENDSIRVDINSIRSEKDKPRRFDPVLYKGYEFIDFR